MEPRDRFIKNGTYQGSYWPTSSWRQCSPESVGFNSEQLKSVYDYLENPAIQSEGVAIIKNGYIVAEAYFGTFTADQRHASYSIAKSFMSAAIGIAIDKGIINSVDLPVYPYFQKWQEENEGSLKRRVTIKHLLSMSSGLEWNEDDYYNNIQDNDVYKMAERENFVDYVLAKDIIAEPGTRWYYSSGDSMLLSGVLHAASGQSTFAFAMTHLLSEIGLSDIQWENDSTGKTIGGWGIRATVREYAKFGYLYLKNGEWNGKQLISRQWIADSYRQVSKNINFYGYQWWLGPALRGFESSGLPKDTYIAWGIFTQQIFVVPSLNLLVVRVANDPGSEAWNEVEFLTKIINALSG